MQHTAGRYSAPPVGGFNPHPPLGAGATPYSTSTILIASLQFQSTPALGGGCNAMHAHLERGKLHLVSIHTRPWGRVQPPGMGQLYTRGQRFNPHPPLGAGATRNTSFQPLGVGLFQSTPALGGGCNLYLRYDYTMPMTSFNPHPPLGAGATRFLGSTNIASGPFQSTPALGGGCNPRPRRRLFASANSPFQSTPALGGGCNDSPPRAVL